MHLLFAALLAWSSWHTSAIVQDRGYPVFTVDAKPFFIYGAAFFYERVPREQWKADLEAYRELGINTIDLYVIWNWHEPQPGVIDFDGRTNPRRDLVGLMKIIHLLGFKVILRPGPVIRNEWRNGGYPWWLLERPEYNMPLHDVLEGRYPATATYQNAHADAAADEWLHNPTHLRESARWLREVFREVSPWSRDIVAIALDDDQGAYPDNDTWPAPHWHEYVNWLKRTVQSSAGRRVPLFINTWQMKVTASAPVWAWGNQYVNDTYSMADHDIDELALSTALLQTQPAKPVMISEFQAGWLQGADQAAPQTEDPANTTIALHELLQYGAHGVVNFPVQDTVYPAGWEAPWANHDYAWDAAFGLNGITPRFAPTRDFGRTIQSVPDLASMHVKNDVAIAWLASAYDPALLTNQRAATLANATIDQLHLCRWLALTCRLVDLRFAADRDLGSIARLVVPATGIPLAFNPLVERRLASLRARRVPIRNTVAEFSNVPRANGGVTDAALLVNDAGTVGLFDVFNATNAPRTIPSVELRVGRKRVRLAAMELPARSATDVIVGAAPKVVAVPAMPNLHAVTGAADDTFEDGTPTFVLQNNRVRAVISADAGARSFVFRDVQTGRNGFTSIGAARDDVENPLPPSSRDYIAKYTHPFPAGTFNRPYDCRTIDPGPQHNVVACTYTAPDLAATPVRFEKTFELDANSPTLVLTTKASADAVSISAVTDRRWLAVDCSACDITDATGYRLVRLHVKAGQLVTVRFTIQGPPEAGPNRP